MFGMLIELAIVRILKIGTRRFPSHHPQLQLPVMNQICNPAMRLPKQIEAAEDGLLSVWVFRYPSFSSCSRSSDTPLSEDQENPKRSLYLTRRVWSNGRRPEQSIDQTQSAVSMFPGFSSIRHRNPNFKCGVPHLKILRVLQPMLGLLWRASTVDTNWIADIQTWSGLNVLWMINAKHFPIFYWLVQVDSGWNLMYNIWLHFTRMCSGSHRQMYWKTLVFRW